jgi:hypothetical protein
VKNRRSLYFERAISASSISLPQAQARLMPWSLAYRSISSNSSKLTDAAMDGVLSPTWLWRCRAVPRVVIHGLVLA